MVLFEDGTDLEVSDIIDIKFLQEFQDIFSELMGFACLTIDSKGPITKLNNFTEFCGQYNRKIETSSKKCEECNLKWAKIAGEKAEPIIYECHRGVTVFVVPIIVEGIHIASIIGGQVFTKKPNEKYYRDVAKEIGADEDEYIKALNKVKIVSKNKIQQAVELLSLIANNFSNLGNKNLKLIRENKKESITKDIIAKMSETLDADEIKKYFINVASGHFHPDRCIFAEYDKEVNKFKPFRLEKLGSSKIQSLLGVDVEKSFPEFSTKLKKGKNIIIRDLEKTLSRKKLLGYKAAETLKNSNVKSDYGFLVKYQDEILGVLIIHYVNKKRAFNLDELDFLKVLRDHAGVAIHQAELYENIQKKAKKEQFLRKIFEVLRSDLDIDSVKTKIVTEIGKALEVDICDVVLYDPDRDIFFVDKYCEYRSSSKEKSYVGRNSQEKEFKWFIDRFLQKEEISFDNVEEFIAQNNLKGTLEEGHLIDYEVKSAYFTSIYYADKLLGYLMFFYTRDYKKITEDNIKFIKDVSIQTGTALYQSGLYKQVQENAEREKVLREITNKMRNSLILEDVASEISSRVGKLFKANRVVVLYYDQQSKQYVINEKHEYTSSIDIKKSNELNLSEVPGFDESIKKVHEKGKDIIFNNLEEYLDENKLRGTDIEKFYRDLEFVASAALNIYYKNIFLGNLVVSFNKPKDFSNEDIDFLKSIADQAGIAFYQSELYLKVKKQAEQESLLRNISEAIRNTLDISETKQKIVDVIGKTFNADRCFLMEYNKSNDRFLIVNEEYLSSDEVKPYKGVNLNDHIPNIIAGFKQGKRLIINESRAQLGNENIDIHGDNFKEEQKAIEEYKVYSALGFPLFYLDEFLGDLILHFVEVKHDISDEDFEFLNLLSDQIAIALHQATLYEQVQLQAERERINRSIVEILRSTLDKETIKRLFVKNIGKYFNADRVIFAEFNSEESKYIPIEKNSEYLSSPEVKSFVGVNFSDPILASHIRPFYEKREVLIPVWEEYIKTKPHEQSFLDLYEASGVKSSYSFPVLYEGELLGYFCIHFTNRIFELLDEDITRIRSICTQAGIALYHADLYTQAQEALRAKGELINKVKNELQEPVNNIINSCNQLMELTKIIVEEANY